MEGECEPLPKAIVKSKEPIHPWENFDYPGSYDVDPGCWPAIVPHKYFDVMEMTAPTSYPDIANIEEHGDS